MLFRQIIRYFAAVMKCPFYISLLLCCIIGLAACTGPVILEEEEKTEIKNGDEDKNEETPMRDSVTIVHEGTYASPYSIGEAQTLGRGKDVWIEGYIVGCVDGSMKNGCQYNIPVTVASNILLADTFPTGSENDYLYCMPAQLPEGIDRDELNLYDNPDKYHRKVRIQGDITLYYKVAGIKNIGGYIFCDDKDEDDDENDDNEGNVNDNYGNEEEDPDIHYDPDVTRNDTLSIVEGIKLQNKGEQPYIKGYIIGYYNGTSLCLYPTEEQISTRASNNVVLADSIGETSTERIIIVELPTGTALRNKVNLKDNPQNLYHALTVKGMLMDYKDTSYPGCTNTLSAFGDDKDYYFSLE